MSATRQRPARELGATLRGVDLSPTASELLRIAAAVFDDAVGVFERYDDQALRFTDATTVALCRRHDIDAVVSFDDDFDGITERIDPQSI